MIAKVNVVKDKLEQNELCPALFASFRRFGFISRRGRELSVAAKAFVELVKKSPLPIVHQPARSPGGQATLSEAPVTHAPSSATSQPRAPEALLTPLRFIERSARVYPGKLAVRYGQPDQTYSQFARRVRQLASALRQAGLQPGDRVAFICANLPPLLEAHFGVPLAGGVLVPINVRLAAGEIACILNHSGARFLFVDSQFSASVRPLRGHLETPLEMIDIVDGQRTKPLGNLTYEDFLESGSAKTATWPLKNEDELISLNYTSGTTGKPKGVMFSHRGAYLNALGNIIELGLTSASIVLWTLPMFHCNGWGLTWAATAVGATHICLRKFEDATIWRLITMENVSHLCGAPSLMAHLLNCPDRPTALRQPLAVFVGGAPPSAELIQQWEALGARFLHGYGLTETCGGYVICEPQPEWAKLPPAERARLLRRQGVPFVTGDALRIVDEKLRDVPADGQTLGEVIMRGSAVTPGYYKEPEATARDFRDGWLNTGDLAVVHPDGYLELLDRRHDIVILDGEHVSSIEIEQTLAQHELSRTSSGKVPKNILREKEWAGHEKRIHGV